MHSPAFSLEVFPPRRNGPVGTIFDTLDGLEGLKPDFISVTYGHGSQSDRTITARIAHTIHTEYAIPTVAHLTSLYADTEIVDEALSAFKAAGVTAVLALRGDAIAGAEPRGVFAHASDLVKYIHEHDPDFAIFGACYPEGHYQASSLTEDVAHLKIKVDAGVCRLFSQLFYDNDDYFRFLDQVREADINIPIEAGIMPITNKNSVLSMAKRACCKVPPAVSRMLDKWSDSPEALQEAGIVYASAQIADLVARGVDGVHLYTMNRPAVTRRIWRNVEPLFRTQAESYASVSAE